MNFTQGEKFFVCIKNKKFKWLGISYKKLLNRVVKNKFLCCFDQVLKSLKVFLTLKA